MVRREKVEHRESYLGMNTDGPRSRMSSLNRNEKEGNVAIYCEVYHSIFDPLFKTFSFFIIIIIAWMMTIKNYTTQFYASRIYYIIVEYT